MREKKTEAIILDSRDIFDADRSLLLFTKNFGKIRARAKGVRRPTSRLTGHLLIYLPTQLELVETGEWYLITQANLRQSPQGNTYPADSLSFLKQAAILAEAINKLFIEQDSHPVIYDGLSYTLERLNHICATESDEAEQKAALVVAEFLLKALGELGYRPELKHCVVTNKPVSEDFIAWNSRLGGILSQEGFELVFQQGFPVDSSGSIVVLRELMKPSFMAEKLTMSKKVRQEVSRLIYDYLQTQIGLPLKSLSG